MRKEMNRSEKQNVLYRLLFLAVLLLISFLCFYRLDQKYVDPYDEARHGVNACEMLRERELVESTYRYETDYYNLKPPLSMWCIMLSFLILGKNVFALRAYSAVCYIILAAGVGVFVKKHYGYLESILAMGFLAVNTVPFQAHMIRAGDADSLYVLLFTFAMLCMLEIPEKTERLYLCGLFFSLAFLTKSFHAGVIAVIGLVYLFFGCERNKWKPAVLIRFALITAFPLLFWAILRFRVDGITFFGQMLYVDVLGRTNGTLNNNQQPFGWYAEYFLGAMSGRLTIYLWATVICMIGIVYDSHMFTKARVQKVMGYVLWILLPFASFSAVTNKLIWYMYPVTVPLLMCAGIVSGKLLGDSRIAPAVRGLIACGIAALFLVYGSREILMIRSQGGNEFQQLLTDAAEQFGDAADTAYMALAQEDGESLETNTVWAQQDVFLAELYGDWQCKDGGMEAFRQQERGILFVSKTLLDGQDVLSDPEGESVLMKSLESDHYVVFIR